MPYTGSSTTTSTPATSSSVCLSTASPLASGDFDSDGFADLAVGVYFEDIGGAINAGAVNGVYGGPDGITATGDQVWDQNDLESTGGAEHGDEIGCALAALPSIPAVFVDGFESGDLSRWSDSLP